MREDRRNVAQIDAFDRVEREPLIGETDRDAASADGLKTFGENRTEACGRTLEHTKRRVELVSEPRRRRREWQRDDLAGERSAELRELAFEATVEVPRVGGAAGQRHVAVDDQPVRSIEVLEDPPQLGDLHRDVDRFLRGRRHSRSKQSHEYPYDCSAHRSSTTYRISVMIQPPADFSSRSVCRLDAVW